MLNYEPGACSAFQWLSGIPVRSGHDGAHVHVFRVNGDLHRGIVPCSYGIQGLQRHATVHMLVYRAMMLNSDESVSKET